MLLVVTMVLELLLLLNDYLGGGKPSPIHNRRMMANIIIKDSKPDNFGKTRSQHEENLRKEWGSTITDEQLDKLKFVERKIKEKTGQTKNFITAPDIDKVK